VRILFVNHYSGGPKYGMAFRPHYLAKYWVRDGHEVTVVGSRFAHQRHQQPDCFTEEVDGVRYFWLWTPPYLGNGVKRVINIFVFVGQLFLNLFRWLKLKPDAVVASSTYPLDIFPIWLIARLSGAKLVFELHDIWPLSPMELGNMSKWHPFIMVMRMAERFMHKTADQIVSILPKTYEYLKSQGVEEERWAHVPNGIDLDEWQAAEAATQSFQTLVSDLKEKGMQTICYAGAHGVPNALHIFIEAAKKFENRLAFILIGGGPEKEKLVGLAKNSSNVFFVDRVSKAGLIGHLELMDFLYISLQKQPLFRFGVSPNKLFDYMMVAKPIISAVTAGNDLVTECACGWSLEAENVTALEATLEKALNSSSEERRAMGQRGKDAVVKRFSYEQLAKDFLQYLK